MMRDVEATRRVRAGEDTGHHSGSRLASEHLARRGLRVDEVNGTSGALRDRTFVSGESVCVG